MKSDIPPKKDKELCVKISCFLFPFLECYLFAIANDMTCFFESCLCCHLQHNQPFHKWINTLETQQHSYSGIWIIFWLVYNLETWYLFVFSLSLQCSISSIWVWFQKSTFPATTDTLKLSFNPLIPLTFGVFCNPKSATANICVSQLFHCHQ